MNIYCIKYIPMGTNLTILILRSRDWTKKILFSNMGRYPVLVVQGNSKYGILSRKLFGSQIDIYRSLVGFKPY